MEFRSWGKTPRLFRDIVITEKIDGTNSAIIFEDVTNADVDLVPSDELIVRSDGLYRVGAQSKNRLIYPGKTTDNFDFAAWVKKNAEVLFDALGPGHHFGEWWGKGIQKRYGDLDYRVFSLFNTSKHEDTFLRTQTHEGLEVMVERVPVLYEGEFSEGAIHMVAQELLKNGSVAVPFHPNPEGLVIYHTQSKQVYKFTFDNNDKGKWEYDGSVPTQD